MNITDVKIGTKFEITVYNYDKSEIEKTYISQLEEVLSSTSIVISTPISEGNIIPISVNSSIKIVFHERRGLFTFKGVIQARGKRENILVLKVELKSELKKIQRREYFRFEWVMHTQFKVIEDETRIYEEADTPLFDAFTKDISGGGVGLITSKGQSRGTRIEVELDLEDGKKVDVSGVVVRSAVYERDCTKYDIGVRFTNVPARHRDMIIKFIFDKQTKLIQKGMV